MYTHKLESTMALVEHDKNEIELNLHYPLVSVSDLKSLRVYLDRKYKFKLLYCPHFYESRLTPSTHAGVFQRI